MLRYFLLSILCLSQVTLTLADAPEFGGGGGGASVSDTVYGSSWNGVATVAPSKNAVYDKIETISGGSVGGADTQVQFNDATAFGGDVDFTWNKTTNILTVTGTVAATTVTGANVTTGADPGHTHTGTSISGIDISGDTNLSGDTENVLTGDALSIGAAITRDTEWDTVSEINTATTDADFYYVGGTDVSVADGGTGKSSWTQYLIPYADTTTSFSQIAIGTSGQVLMSNGAGLAPTFQTPAAGSEVNIVLLPQQGKLNYSTTLFEDCEDIFDPAANVTVTVAAGQVGTNSTQMDIAAGHTTGLIASEAITSLNAASGSMVQLWVYSSIALAASDVALLLDDTASCASATHVLNLPAISSATWTLLKLGYNGSVSGTTALISVGARQVVDKGAYSLILDDLKILSSGAIDASQMNYQILCDPVLNEGAMWETVIDDDYGAGTLYADVYWTAASATTGTASMTIFVKAITAADSEDVNINNLNDGVYAATGFDLTGNSTTAAVPVTAGYSAKTTITLTNKDSLAAGDLVWIAWQKNGTYTDAGNTHTGDFELQRIVVRE